MSAPRGRRPPELGRLGHGRYAAEGHRQSCPGQPSLSIRMENGVYRIARSCGCGVLREIDPGRYETYGEAEAAVGPGWWRDG